MVPFVNDRARATARVFTDGSTTYNEVINPHETVKHSAGEYVRGQIHTNGIESFWSMLKRAHKGKGHVP